MNKSSHVKISKRKSRRVRRGGAGAAFKDELTLARDIYLDNLSHMSDCVSYTMELQRFRQQKTSLPIHIKCNKKPYLGSQFD